MKLTGYEFDGPAQIGRLKYLARTLIGSSPALFFPLSRLLGEKQGRGLVDADTDLVIEGFPRSANSFAVRALALRNPGLRIASHVHCAAQVIRGVALNKPTLVIVREPRSALAAFRVGYPNMSEGLLAWSYWSFYRAVERVQESVVIADFAAITRDYEPVIAALNDRFALQLEPYRNSPESDREVFETMTVHGARSDELAAPSAKRSEQIRALDVSGRAPFVASCERLYARLAARCVPG